MDINHISVECKFYIPFDYSFPPYKEYIPPIPFLETVEDIEIPSIICKATIPLEVANANPQYP